MKVKNANVVRAEFIEKFRQFLEAEGEDVALIANNCLNFPVVAEDGEEGFVEVLVKIPNDNDGFEKREDFTYILQERKEREEKAAIAKAKKIEQDRKRREEKEAERKRKEKEKAEGK